MVDILIVCGEHCGCCGSDIKFQRWPTWDKRSPQDPGNGTASHRNTGQVIGHVHHVSVGMASSACLIFHLWLTDRVKERIRVYLPVLLAFQPTNNVFSRSALLKRTILSSLPAVSALHLNSQMAPVAGRNEKSSKMHSRVVSFPPDPPSGLRADLLSFFPRSSSALDRQDTPPPSTWPEPISSLSFSKVSWPTALPPVDN